MNDPGISEAPSQETLPGKESSNSYVVIFGVIMLIGLLFLAWMGRPPRIVAEGEPLPRLDLQPLLNVSEPIDNGALEGKLAVLHFWGTWCPPCQKEFPEFAKLVEEFLPNESVEIISVSCSQGPEYDLDALAKKTDAFLSDFDVRIPTYADGAAMTRQQLALILSNGSLGYPTTLLVGRDGRILKSLEGYYPGDMEELADILREQL